MRLHERFQSPLGGRQCAALDDHGPLNRLARLVLLGALSVLCAYMALIALGRTADALAQPSAPAYLGEVVASEVPGGELGARAVAVEEGTGNVVVLATTAANNTRLLVLSPYGAFVREMGTQVNHTNVLKRMAEEAAKEAVTVTAQEEDLCTAASKDQCGESKGSLPHRVVNAGTIALEQSTGAIYLISKEGAGSVVKLTGDGEFLWTIGNAVNKTKVQEREHEEANAEKVTVSKEEEDICTGASGDECQAGKQGASGSLFETSLGGETPIAVGGPQERLYVGGKGRVQIFDAAGKQIGEDSLSALSSSGTVGDLAVNPAGDVFLSDGGVEGVHEIEPSGTLSSNIYGTLPYSQIRSIAVDNSGHLYVGQYKSAFEYEVADPSAAPAQFGTGEPGAIYFAFSLAVDPTGTIYVYSGASHKGLLMFGSLAQMEAAYGAPSPLEPSISTAAALGGSNSGEVTLQATINPQLRATTYQFQYGSAPCSAGGCIDAPATPAPLGSLTKTRHAVSSTLTGLAAGQTYYFRVLAENAVGTSTAAERAFTIGAPVAGGPAGLPDGRIYELVSPANKHGNEVETERMSVVAANGNAVLYVGSGAMGESTSSLVSPFISRRTPAGWLTASAVPAQITPHPSYLDVPEEVVPSASFTRVLFSSASSGRYSSAQPGDSVNIFLSESPAREPLWLGEPKFGEPVPAPGEFPPLAKQYLIAGGSPELNTVYFGTEGTLLAVDAARGHYVEQHFNSYAGATKPWGFYEWHDGALSYAGTLPDGSASPFGAIQASYAGVSDFSRENFQLGRTMPANLDHQVSESGHDAFFVSPDPVASSVTDAASCEAAPGTCTSEAPQLYVRETAPDGAKRTVLVSQSQLPGHNGQPALDGAMAVQNGVQGPTNANVNESYVYASPNGSQAFFVSTDQLTSAAPNNAGPKEYDFNLATEELTYLPGVAGPILAAASDGSDFIFEDKSESPWQLKLWSSGPGGGSVRPVAQVPAAAEPPEESSATEDNVDNAHASESGSVFVFGTDAQVPAGFNNGGGFWQMYRYSVAAGELSCLSCPSHGQAPIGDAEASYSNREEGVVFGGAHSTLNTRVLSSDGNRVFFDSPNALVPAASSGVRNVYEWENGKVYLISSGTSSQESFIMGSSASGNDVFFVTSAGLAPGDTDGAYDVYDARVPRPGDVLPPEAVPCEGAVCQGPPSTPELLSPPASASFRGPGNPAPAPPAHRRARHHRGRAHRRHKRGRQKTRRRRRHRRKLRHGRRRGRGPAHRRHAGHAHRNSKPASHRRRNGRGK